MMRIPFRLAAFAAGCFAGAAAHAATPGWENVCAERREFPPAKVLWTCAGDVRFELRDGAEGDVSCKDGRIRIVKCNSKGRIVVQAPAFKAEQGREIRMFADVSASTGDPDAALGFLRAYPDGKESLGQCRDIDYRWFAGGGPYMRQLINSAPGMTYRKYAHSRTGGGMVTPVIVVEGAPSRSEWSNWTVEDLAAAQDVWQRHWDGLCAKNRSHDMEGEDAFARRLAADVEHVARIEVIDGVSRLVVDGRKVPPVAFKEKHSEGPARNRFTYAGKPLSQAGLPLTVIDANVARFPNQVGYWDDDGFDVEGYVSHIRDRMRAAGDSLIVLSIGCSAPRHFMDAHPGEVWLREDGSVVRGDEGSAVSTYSSTGKVEADRIIWPWPSYASPAWKRAIKDKITAIVAELKRTGLAKRIVGVHFFGYHDAQFAAPFEDHSKPAKDEYARYRAEGGTGDYSMFMRQIGFRAQEEFARHAKRLFGKDMIAVRWCMAPFGGGRECSFDLTAFARSDAIDVVVPQPTYVQRLPAIAQGPRLPTESFHRHGKLMWYEFDLRTWAALETWAQSAVALKGLGHSDDFPMWQTVFRKHAGIMLARRMGWWFFDMGGGWFTPENIVGDIKAVVDVARDLQSTPPDPWHPSVAVVIDEESMACYNMLGHPKVKNVRSMVLDQWPRLSASGVPYDVWLAEDAMGDASWAGRYKAVILSGFIEPDARRTAFMDALEAKGMAMHVTRPGGFSASFFNDFVAMAGGYVATRPGVQVDMNGDFASVHCLVPGEYDFRLPFPCRVVNLADGREAASDGGSVRLSLTAGETCWFRIRRKDAARK